MSKGSHFRWSFILLTGICFSLRRSDTERPERLNHGADANAPLKLLVTGEPVHVDELLIAIYTKTFVLIIRECS